MFHYLFHFAVTSRFLAVNRRSRGAGESARHAQGAPPRSRCSSCTDPERSFACSEDIVDRPALRVATFSRTSFAEQSPTVQRSF